MTERSRTRTTQSSPPPLDPKISTLFLDLDGSIVEIVARPHEVDPDAELTSILERLDALMGGRVAVLTGRTLEDADRILEGRVVSVAAVHGLVRRMPDSSITRTTSPTHLLQAKRLLLAFAQTQPGLIVEDKGLSMAVHYRQAQHAESAVRAATERIAQAAGLVVQAGSMVSEVRTPGPDKGDSLKDFMNITPFAGSMPVMVGDYGILVGRPRASAARYRLASVTAVRAWLAAGTTGWTC
jgi:trehalose 6-phosphate phosphatase